MVNEKIVVFLCNDEIEDIFTAIYKAWCEGTSHTDVRIVTSCMTYSMFEEYRHVSSDTVLADKVGRSIINKLSYEIYLHVLQVLLSDYDDKASCVYKFLQRAFKSGRYVINNLQDDNISRFNKISKNFSNEAHWYIEIVRFSENDDGLLISKIEPQNNILSFVSEHFADRLHCENWIIYDVGRKLASIHKAHGNYVIFHDVNIEIIDELLELTDKEEQYRKLWQTFFENIAIKERANPSLQRNKVPLKYRKYMTENFDYDNKE
ncbi:MAG: TIGR03915 family putative DNA repair protein [Lachnospira sp.]|nr:TIGR03915 family putative DNA repair protein [Lachnospira sp.]MDD5827660.1 TIGR03915 family putative DNA repair protein [Lachnospira sp.]